MKGRVDGCQEITAKHISRKHPKVRRQNSLIGGGKQEDIFKREQLAL